MMLMPPAVSHQRLRRRNPPAVALAGMPGSRDRFFSIAVGMAVDSRRFGSCADSVGRALTMCELLWLSGPFLPALAGGDSQFSAHSAGVEELPRSRPNLAAWRLSHIHRESEGSDGGDDEREHVLPAGDDHAPGGRNGAAGVLRAGPRADL